MQIKLKNELNNTLIPDYYYYYLQILGYYSLSAKNIKNYILFISLFIINKVLSSYFCIKSTKKKLMKKVQDKYEKNTKIIILIKKNNKNSYNFSYANFIELLIYKLMWPNAFTIKVQYWLARKNVLSNKKKLGAFNNKPSKKTVTQKNRAINFNFSVNGPKTKKLYLEGLDQVFSIKNKTRATVDVNIKLQGSHMAKILFGVTLQTLGIYWQIFNLVTQQA